MSKPLKSEFIKDMASFVQEGLWKQFVHFMDQRGVDAKQSEKWIEEIEDGNFR